MNTTGTSPPKKKEKLRSILGFWHPDGVIVDDAEQTHVFQVADFGRLPLVYSNRNMSSLDGSTPCVGSDSYAIAEIAFRELFSRDCAAYAYLEWFLPTSWSVERGEAFERLVRSADSRFFRHRMPEVKDGAPPAELSEWLVGLPKPCGIFAVNDRVGCCAVSSAVKAGVSVPHDVAVVGVDNEVRQCEASPVPLTSIPQDNEGGGWMAAQLLDDLMAGRPVRLAQMRVLDIVRRASSHCPLDRRVERAVEFIRNHAFERIGTDDVVAVMGCSRSLAYLLFKKMTGHSILHELHSVRLTKAKELLRSGMPSGVVSDMCGFASPVDFRRRFKMQTGMTPKQWALADSCIVK